MQEEPAKKLVAAAAASIALVGSVATIPASQASAAPQPTAAPMRPAASSVVWLAHTKAAVNVHTAPSTRARVETVIPRGYWVLMTRDQPYYGRHEDGAHWIKVVVNGHTGYLNAGVASGMWISTTWHNGSHPQKVDAKREAKLRAAHL